MIARPFIFFVFLMLFNSCGFQKYKLNSRKDINSYYRSADSEQFILSTLPDWANFSQTSNCKRNSPVTYLHLQRIMHNFNFNYLQAIQFQLMYNHKLERKMKEKGQRALHNRDREVLFFNVKDNIKAYNYLFKTPQYKRIHLVWIDQAIHSKVFNNRLAALMKSNLMKRGRPIFISLCLNYEQLDQFSIDNEYENYGAYLLPHEMFSIYNNQGEINPFFSLNLDHLFKKDQSIFLFIPKELDVPHEFIGIFTIKRY